MSTSTKLIKNITVGSDPEIFIVDKLTNQIVPAYTFTNGSKEQATKVDDIKVLSDNVMLEFNIEPCRTSEGFANTIGNALESITNKVIPKSTMISSECSLSVSKEYLKDKKVLEFGCMPDWNAWDLSVNKVGKPKDKAQRCSGGHLHYGFDNAIEEQSLEMLRLFDLFLGLPSIAEDKDTKRKELYGKAGAFRLTPYGFEYRVLSNYWIFSKENVQRTFDRIMLATDYRNEGNTINPKSDVSKMIVEAINSQDNDLAKRIYKKVLTPSTVSKLTLQT